MNYLLVFIAALVSECLTTLWTRAVAKDKFWVSVGLSFLSESLSWGIFIMAITTDWTLCPFAILGNTLGTAIVMRAAKAV
jgi:hypothetical protein